MALSARSERSRRNGAHTHVRANLRALASVTVTRHRKLYSLNVSPDCFHGERMSSRIKSITDKQTTPRRTAPREGHGISAPVTSNLRYFKIILSLDRGEGGLSRACLECFLGRSRTTFRIRSVYVILSSARLPPTAREKTRPDRELRAPGTGVSLLIGSTGICTSTFKRPQISRQPRLLESQGLTARR